AVGVEGVRQRVHGLEGDPDQPAHRLVHEPAPEEADPLVEGTVVPPAMGGPLGDAALPRRIPDRPPAGQEGREPLLLRADLCRFRTFHAKPPDWPPAPGSRIETTGDRPRRRATATRAAPSRVSRPRAAENRVRPNSAQSSQA